MLDSFQRISTDHYTDLGMHGNFPIEYWLEQTERDDPQRIETLNASIVNCRLLGFDCRAEGFLSKAQSITSEVVLLALYKNEAFQRFAYWSQHLYLFNGETLRQLAE